MSEMLRKSFAVLETKADGKTGEFTALVSVFGNVDSVGDRILPGAYTKTLKKWVESGDPLPLILSHQWENPHSHIGVADPKDIKQTPQGLLVKGKLDVADNDVAKQVYKLMARRSLKEFSIGYRVPDGGEALAEDGANDISEIDLVECGPTLKGANSETQLVAIKSALQEAEPRSEQELRRAAGRVEQDRIAERLPEANGPGPDVEFPEVEALTAMVQARKAESEKLEVENRALKAQLKAQEETRSEEDLKREADRVAREAIAEHLPEGEVIDAAQFAGLKASVEKLTRELAEAKGQLAIRSEQQLKRETDRLERDRIEPTLPGGEVEPPPNPELEAAKTELAALTQELEAAQTQLDTRSEEQLKRAAEKLEQDRIAETLPEGEPEPKEPEPDPLELMAAELAAVKTELQGVSEKLAEQKSREPTRTRDALRERSDQTALEIQSGGVSLRKPPTPKQEPVAVVDETDLRRRSRETMLEILTGVGNDAQ